MSLFRCGLPMPWNLVDDGHCIDMVREPISECSNPIWIGSILLIMLAACLVDHRRRNQRRHGDWLHGLVCLDHRQAPDAALEESHDPDRVPASHLVRLSPFFSDPFLSCSLLRHSNCSVVGTALAQLVVYWNVYDVNDVSSSLYLPTILNQVVLCCSIVTACLPYLKPLMASLESGIVRVPDEADELAFMPSTKRSSKVRSSRAGSDRQ